MIMNGDNMKELIKKSSILFLFFIIFLFKEAFYGLLIQTNNLDKLDASIKQSSESYYKEEYFNILESFNIHLDDNYDYAYSKILYRNIYDYFEEITILKGSNHSLKEGLAIINEKGLIGTIIKVNKNSSQVRLITSQESEISVMVNQAYGILKNKDSKLQISSINNYEDIEIGDVVYTSDIGSLPNKIAIGKISKVVNNALGIEKTIMVEPYVDFDKIDYIAILNGEM